MTYHTQAIKDDPQVIPPGKWVTLQDTFTLADGPHIIEAQMYFDFADPWAGLIRTRIMRHADPLDPTANDYRTVSLRSSALGKWAIQRHVLMVTDDAIPLSWQVWHDAPEAIVRGTFVRKAYGPLV